ncbi:4-hydroxyphenylalkanoate adenylyltransferase [bacterium HR33]|nr:4-hydroxyphenylalkanoate adenylyltransferase [bacterium HR33]
MTTAARAEYQLCLERVLAVVRELALEVGGERALRAVAPAASLERDVGLGSLERVELVTRLESAFERDLDERFLLLDTPEALARALFEQPGEQEVLPRERIAAVSTPRGLGREAATLNEALWHWALEEPHRTHVYLLSEDGKEEPITYGRLWDLAATVAGGLRDRGVSRGDTVAIILPTGFDFLASFMGVLLAEAVAVPLYPPVRLDRLEEYFARQSRILQDAGTRCIITVPEALAVARELRGKFGRNIEILTAGDLASTGVRAGPNFSSPETPAMIQYTSGSTGHPKGVLLTHGNLVASIRAIAEALEIQPSDSGASWLPLYHDMGLIGTWLNCVYHGIPLSLMSPLSFLARPERWLWAIHRRRITLSAAPNFAYELCVRKVPDRAIEGLDLSSWRCALNGAEPVSPDTLERFTRRFARYGFRAEALMPVYGLAECTVGLCIPPLGRRAVVDVIDRERFELEGRAEPAERGSAQAMRFVSVGGPLPGHEVRVVDDSGRDVPDRVVGRLVFRGPSAMAGYFRNAQATAAISLPGGWLDSGDLAYRVGGEFFIAGRRKDLIIKAGRNLIPQEIEEVAGEIDGVRKGCVVAFGLSEPELGTEKLVLVAETRIADRSRLLELEREIVQRVTAAIGVPPDRVVLVPPRSIPKTPSGKLQRAATRDLFLSGGLGETTGSRWLRRLKLVGQALGALWERLSSRVGRGLYAAYLGLVLGAAAILLGPPLWLAALLIPDPRGIRFISRLAAKLALKLGGWRLSAEGLHNLPREGPVILVCNHASYADVPALLALLPLDFVFVAKREVLSWPFIGTLARGGRHPAVERWQPLRSVADARRVAAAVDRGDSVLFFPEGTFTAASGLRSFRLGAFELAVERNIPVVPLALRGTRRILRAGKWWPRHGSIHLWVGEPLHPEGTGWRAAVSLRDRALEQIADHCGEPRLDLVDAGPIRPSPRVTREV